MNNKRITSQDLIEQGWKTKAPGIAFGKALKIGNELLASHGFAKTDALQLLAEVLENPNDFKNHARVAPIAKMLLYPPPPKQNRHVEGKCQKYGKLSFEHVPPQSAFNAMTVRLSAIEEQIQSFMSESDTSLPEGISQQGGMGKHSLCEQCNNDTGTWYGKEYVRWAREAMQVVTEFVRDENEIRVDIRDVYPLRFLKQIVTCFFSVEGSHTEALFAQSNPELVEFVQDRYTTCLPDKYKIYLTLIRPTSSTTFRRLPQTVVLQFKEEKDFYGNEIYTGVKQYEIISEYTHPPFAFILTQDGESSKGTDITFFKKHGYDEKVTITALDLKVGVSDSPYPTDYTNQFGAHFKGLVE